MVINTSHEMNFVYFLGLNIPVQAIITVVTQTKKNISKFSPGRACSTTGSSPTVAPIIITNNRIMARYFFFFPISGSASNTDNIKNTRLSPHVGIKVPSASRINVSFSDRRTFIQSPWRRSPLRCRLFTVAP